MELILDKLGRIEHAEIDIRPLTVFVGENNTNKTWAAYSLYGLARYLSWSWSSPVGGEFGHGRLPVHPPQTSSTIEDNIRRALTNMPQDSDVTTFSVPRKDLVDGVTDDVVFSFPYDRIRELLRLSDEVPVDSRASLRVTPGEFRSNGWQAALTVHRRTRQVFSKFSAERVNPSFAWQAAPGAPAHAVDEHVNELLHNFALRFLGPGTVFALPAERKALVTTYKLHRPEFVQVQNQPVVEFSDMLLRIENLSQSVTGSLIPDALAHLENAILHGTMQFEPAATGLRLVYAPRHGGTLPLHGSASLVRALAGLHLYLAHMVNRGDFLIIDEPEMNAHPEAQLRITELIAYLVNKGVRVVLTTHSPYIVDHLNNLMGAADLSDADQADVAPHFKLGTAECFVHADKVAVYDFKAPNEDAPVEVTPILDRERHLIDWQTFGRTTEYVTNLFPLEILSRLYRDQPPME